MKKHDKLAKKENINESAFILVDSPSWRNPQHLTIKSLSDILNIKIGIDSSANVFIVNFNDQDINPKIPPNTHKLDTKLELAVDNNFLYVWVKNRWKRIPLSSF